MQSSDLDDKYRNGGSYRNGVQLGEVQTTAMHSKVQPDLPPVVLENKKGHCVPSRLACYSLGAAVVLVLIGGVLFAAGVIGGGGSGGAGLDAPVAATFGDPLASGLYYALPVSTPSNSSSEDLLLLSYADADGISTPVARSYNARPWETGPSPISRLSINAY